MVEIVNKKYKKEIKFTCFWCNFKFTRWVGEPEGEGIRKVGPQIQCPACQMFIKTNPNKPEGWRRIKARR